MISQEYYDAARAILSALGASESPTAVNLLVAWIRCEKPPGEPWQWWNPLNTTLQRPGSMPVNTALVQAYPSREAGVQAVVATIRNGYYPTLLAALQRGDANLFFSAPNEISTWGTHASCIQQVFSELPAETPGETVPTGTVPSPVATPVAPSSPPLAVVTPAGPFLSAVGTAGAAPRTLWGAAAVGAAALLVGIAVSRFWPPQKAKPPA